MKRIFPFVALTLLIVLMAFAAFHSSASTEEMKVQFYGIAKYANGNPAPINTTVRASLSGVVKGTATVQGSNGAYSIVGFDSNFPSGNYVLDADDHIGMIGDENVYHAVHTDTEQDIVLNIAY